MPRTQHEGYIHFKIMFVCFLSLKINIMEVKYSRSSYVEMQMQMQKKKTQTEGFLESIIHECSSDANFTSRKSKVVEGLKKASCYIDHEGTR